MNEFKTSEGLNEVEREKLDNLIADYYFSSPYYDFRNDPDITFYELTHITCYLERWGRLRKHSCQQLLKWYRAKCVKSLYDRGDVDSFIHSTGELVDRCHKINNVYRGKNGKCISIFKISPYKEMRLEQKELYGTNVDRLTRVYVDKADIIDKYYFSNPDYDFRNDPDITFYELEHICLYLIVRWLAPMSYNWALEEVLLGYYRTYCVKSLFSKGTLEEADHPKGNLVDRCHASNNVHRDEKGNIIPIFEVSPYKEKFLEQKNKYENERNDFTRLHERMLSESGVIDKKTKRRIREYWYYK